MNYQSPYQDPLNPINYQFQNMTFGNGGSGVTGADGLGSANGLGGVGQPLGRTASSLADSIGIQRSSSPFVAQPKLPEQIAGAIYQPLEAIEAASVVSPGPGVSTGPANGWSRSVNGSSMSSPYPAQLAQTNLYTGSPHFQNLGMPPGMAPSHPVVAESQWKYVDTQGQIQGPFTSSSMSQWYASGYFQPSLQIARQGATPEPFGINNRFVLLAELISRVNDIHDPFMAFDRIVVSAQLNNLNAPITNSVAQPPSQEASAPAPVSVARVESEDFTHDEILQLKDKDGGHYREVLVQIPFSRKNKQKLDSNIEIDTSLMNEPIKELPRKYVSQELAEQHTGKYPELNVETSPKKWRKSSDSDSKDIPETTEALKNIEASKNVDKAKEIELKRQQKAEEMAKKLVEEQERQEEESRKKEELRKYKKQQQKLNDSSEISAQNQIKTAPIVKDFTSPSVKKVTPVVNAPVAPWANRTKNAETPKISIRELQRKEEIELAKRKQQSEFQEKAAALKLQEQIWQQEKADRELKSKLTWANKPIAEPIPIDIKPQIKKQTESEFHSKKKDMATDVSNSGSINELSDPNFIKQQKKLWEDAQRSKSKPSANISNSDGKAWTTVASKTSNNAVRETKVTNQPKSYISPDKLRAVSVTTTKQIGSSTSIPSLKSKFTAPVSYPGNSSIAVRQDFLKWCRSQMKLSPNVSATSVLEVLLSLPAGPEAKEIIADTIYSNSSTMDGRRFALEFIKKRIECEKQIKDPLSWSEALTLPEGQEEDWEFQVVSKKKGRKH